MCGAFGLPCRNASELLPDEPLLLVLDRKYFSVFELGAKELGWDRRCGPERTTDGNKTVHATRIC